MNTKFKPHAEKKHTASLATHCRNVTLRLKASQLIFSRGRRLLLALPACSLLALAAPAQAAEEFIENKPIEMVVPAAPGGISDQVSRLVAPLLSEHLGLPVIVVNSPGASGTIAIRQVLRADPDGHTVVMGAIGPNAINYALVKDLQYKPEDLAPVSPAISLNNVLLASANIGVNTLDDLIERGKTHPDGLSMAVTTIGSSGHLTGELVKSTVGLDAVNIVYKGSSPAQMDLLAGRVDFMVDNLSVALPHIKAGTLIALATITQERLPEIPDVPTIEELGYPGIDSSPWLGVFTSAATPAPLVEKLNEAMQKALATPSLQERFAEIGGQVTLNSVEEFESFVADEIARWTQVIEEQNIVVE